MRNNKDKRLESMTPTEKIKYLERQARWKRWTSPKLQTTLSLVLAFVLLISGSTAYFTDHAHEVIEANAGTVQVSIDDSNINLLDANGQNILNPGDIRDFAFTIQNEGNKSVDAEVIITLTTDIPMHEELGGYAEGGDGGYKNVTQKEVYRSEYELYWADDVELVEGYGHYPIQGSDPVQERYMNAAGTKIVYVVDSMILSGNASLDEKEVEYQLSSSGGNYFELEEGVHYTVKYGDLSSYNSSWGENYYLDISTSAIDTSLAELDTSVTWDLVFPETINVDGNEVVVQYARLPSGKYPSAASRYLVSDQFVGFGYLNISYLDYDDLKISEVVSAGRGVICDDYDALMRKVETSKQLASKSKFITSIEYEQLSDADKALYAPIPDASTYDMVLLFDPFSDNKFQESNVSITVEVRAKQHRNTEAGWELVYESVNSIINDSIFTVDYDEMHRVELTGVKDGVDFASLTDIVIPEGVQVIPTSFFESATNIKTVSLPSTIEEINSLAFQGCTNLTTINFPESLEYIGRCAFDGCTSLDGITFPDTPLIVDAYAFQNCTSLSSVTIPANLSTAYIYDKGYLGEYAFYGCTGLETVVFEDGCTTTAPCMFQGCTNLSSVTLPNTMVEIRRSTFSGCSNLASIELPYGLETIGGSAFWQSGLTSVRIPNSVEFVDGSAFSDCLSLESVILPNNNTTFKSYAFEGCTALKSVKTNGFGADNYIGGAMSEIGNSMFQGCTSLTEITIDVNKVLDSAFYNCNNLTTITITNKVDDIKSSAFICSSYVKTTVYTNNSIAINYSWSKRNRNATILPFSI